MALEYAFSRSDTKEFPLSAINSMVIKILEETGYPDAARNFKNENSSLDIELKTDFSLISHLLARHLGLSGEKLNNTVKLVLESAHGIDITSAPPSFYVELAKVCVKKLCSQDHSGITGIAAVKNMNATPVRASSIKSNLSPKTGNFTETGIIDIAGIGRIFPALKINFSIKKLADLYNLEPPLTELAVITRLHPAAEALNEIINRAATLFHESNSGVSEVPIYLLVPDMSFFAENYLDCRWPDAKKFCFEILSYLQEQVDFKFFSVKMH
jgi:hypothetical protein